VHEATGVRAHGISYLNGNRFLEIINFIVRHLQISSCCCLLVQARLKHDPRIGPQYDSGRAPRAGSRSGAMRASL